MSNIPQTELTKIRKAALYAVALSYEMKATVVDLKLRELTTEIKKVLSKRDGKFEIILLKL